MSGLAAADWDRVHEVVQGVLGEMARDVERRWPEIGSRPGRTTTRRFPLFSFRTFFTKVDRGADPVVVGLDFKPEADGVRVRGDISGEESGRVWYDEECEQTAAKSLDSILAAAQEIAGRLARQSDLLPSALAVPPGHANTPPAQAQAPHADWSAAPHD
jgi:hypothetical protein